MKIIKTNSIKLFVTALTVSSFMLVSCDNAKKTTTEDGETLDVVVVENDNLKVEANDVEVKEGKMTMKEGEVKTRTYKMKKQTPIVYNLDINGISGFDDWSDYTVVNYELASIRKLNFGTTAQRIQNLNYRIAN